MSRACDDITPIAIQERLDGVAVYWPERVTDEQYRGT